MAYLKKTVCSRQHGVALQKAEHREERGGVDKGTTEYSEHDHRGNWLRTTRTHDGAAREIILREIEYVP